MSATIANRFCLGHLTVDILSDDDLLHIFTLYRQDRQGFRYSDDDWPWHSLLHVCQRWRQIIFAWPHHLDLRLDCKSEAAVAKARDVWPALPISIQSALNHESGDGIIFAIEQHRDCIAGINLSGLTGPQLEKCVALMQGPFPVLRTLSLGSNVDLPPVIPDGFSGGSAPRLQMLKLDYIPFTTLPSLLLSASNLVDLHFAHRSSTGYILPDAMAAFLSVLTKLQSIHIVFRYGGSFPKHQTNRCPAPLTRSVLPALASFAFKGDSEYSEDLIARLDAPHLNHLSLKFFYQTVFDVPQVPRFIQGSEIFKPPLFASVDVSSHGIDVSILSPVDGYIFLQTYCPGLDTQLSWLRQICTHLLPLLPDVDELELRSSHDMQLHREDSTLWLEVLGLFSDVQILFVYDDGLEVDIARVLGGLTGERAVEMLPMLHTLVLNAFDDVEHLVTPLLKPFIDTRQLSDHPVVVPYDRLFSNSR